MNLTIINHTPSNNAPDMTIAIFMMTREADVQLCSHAVNATEEEIETVLSTLDGSFYTTYEYKTRRGYEAFCREMQMPSNDFTPFTSSFIGMLKGAPQFRGEQRGITHAYAVPSEGSLADDLTTFKQYLADIL